MTVVTRFAPSPTGELHLGSAYSAWTGWHRAREAGGTFLVRIEDIDIRRCKRAFETAILDDLKWLGFDWDGDNPNTSRPTARCSTNSARAA